MKQKIVEIGNPVLRQKARRLNRKEIYAPEFQSVIDDLIELMRQTGDFGIAATQVGQPIQLFIVEVRAQERFPWIPPIPLTIAINPRITLLSDQVYQSYECCPCVPGIWAEVPRASKIKIQAYDREGKSFEQIIEGLQTAPFLHQYDHLQGIVFIDRIDKTESLSSDQMFRDYYFADYLQQSKERASLAGPYSLDTHLPAKDTPSSKLPLILTILFVAQMLMVGFVSFQKFVPGEQLTLSTALWTEKSLGLDLSDFRDLLGTGLSPDGRRLFQAAISGDVATLDELLKAGMNPEMRDVHGFSPLSAAAQHDQTDIVVRLILNGVNVNTADNAGFTPLMWAVFFGAKNTAKELLLAGANPNLRSHNSETALLIATKNNDTNLSTLLLESGAETGKVDQDGWTALHYAIKASNEELALALLENTAEENIDVRDKDGWTALMHASNTGNRTIIDALLDRGAEAEIVASTSEIKPLSLTAQEPSDNSPDKSRQVKTRLRHKDDKATVIYQRGGIVTLVVETDVKNRGEVTARDIKVEAELIGTNSITLDGPSELDAGESAFYRWSGDLHNVITDRKRFRATRRPEVTVRCSNCRT